MLYLLNIDEVAFEKNELINKYSKILNVSPQLIIPMNIKQENELSLLSDEEKVEVQNELGLKFRALDDLIKSSYDLLELITFFTAGEQEARGWTIKNGYTAPQAAGTIHTDFEKKFIAAEVVNYEDFVKFNGWLGSRAVGKSRIEGKEYVFKDGDVALFRHGA